jgi:proteasome assembly chaperone (PAC2) family protein
MGIIFLKKPRLKNPVMICGWPGIGNIGFIAVETLKKGIGAEKFAEIEGCDFFYPRKIRINEGLLDDIEFPTSTFYFKKRDHGDLIIFIGEEQPHGKKKSYQIGKHVLDVATRYHCKRIFTSGAAVTMIHHHMKPQVWAVPNRSQLIEEIMRYKNTIFMSDIEGHPDQGQISGLNGLLIGMAGERNIEALCLMGEFPLYLAHETSYPKGSRSVLEVLSAMIEADLDFSRLERWIQRTDVEIDKVYKKIPDELRQQIDKIKLTRQTKPSSLTDEEKEEFFKEVEDFLRGSEQGGESSV